MEYIQFIENALADNGITAKKMLIELGYSDSLISQWKKGAEPSAIKLARIAEYLQLSLDVLLLKKEKASSISEDAQKMVKVYMELGEEGRAIIYGRALEELRAQRAADASKSAGEDEAVV